MTVECRPPEGTPDGTWCILRHNRRKRDKWLYAQWADGGAGFGWWRWHNRMTLMQELYRDGWRFYIVAEVPHA